MYRNRTSCLAKESLPVHLAEDRKDLRHRGIKNFVNQGRKHSAKQRRPEYRSRCDLATDERLSETTEEHSKSSRRSNDHDQLHNDDQENVFGMSIRHGLDLSCAVRQLDFHGIQFSFPRCYVQVTFRSKRAGVRKPCGSLGDVLVQFRQLRPA